MKIYADSNTESFGEYIDSQIAYVQQCISRQTNRDTYNAGWLEGQDYLLTDIKRKFPELFEKI